MSMFRRRLMIAAALEQQGGGGGDADMGYVKDGLAFHLDGINKGDDQTTWTDLVKGVKFTYNDCKLNVDNVEFDGIKSFAYNKARREELLFDVHTSTIEIVISDRKATDSIIFMPTQAAILEPVAAHFIDPYIYCLCNVNTGKSGARIGPNTGNRYTISMRNDLIFENLLKQGLNTDSHGWFYKGLICSIGARLDDNLNPTVQYKGKIHSIRIYNRQLTEEEILHNQEVDINRFFGGVIPQ